MGWFLCDHPLVAVDVVQEGTQYLRLVLAISHPAWIHFQTVNMCSVGQLVAGRSHTSLKMDYTRTPDFSISFSRNIVRIHSHKSVFAFTIQELLFYNLILECY